ncbi:MAG: hypothetical protein Q9195_005961 [Heterodermia aff. obscurata]
MAVAAVQTSINFLTNDPSLYETEKPYQIKYNAAPDIPVSNLRFEKQSPITISSIRGREADFSYEKNGFTVLNLSDTVPSYESFDTPEGVRSYILAATAALKARLGANKVQAYQYVIRKRDKDYPNMKDKTVEISQPTSIAHIDTTKAEAAITFQSVNGETLNEQSDLHYQVVKSAPLFPTNVNRLWKPLRGPLYDWPLALCDASTINPSTDLEPCDQVYAESASENMQVRYREQQRWYYLEGQREDEVLVFRQSDSKKESVCGVPHSSFPNPMAKEGELPRESIEVRTLVSYD